MTPQIREMLRKAREARGVEEPLRAAVSAAQHAAGMSLSADLNDIDRLQIAVGIARSILADLQVRVRDVDAAFSRVEDAVKRSHDTATRQARERIRAELEACGE